MLRTGVERSVDGDVGGIQLDAALVHHYQIGYTGGEDIELVGEDELIVVVVDVCQRIDGDIGIGIVTDIEVVRQTDGVSPAFPGAVAIVNSRECTLVLHVHLLTIVLLQHGTVVATVDEGD